MTSSHSPQPAEPQNGRFFGQVVLVTGAGRGIGAATARRFAHEGASVAVADIDRDAAEELAEAIRGVALEMDVCSSDSIARSVSEIEKRMGPLDCLVNNAGTGEVRFFADIDESGYNHLLDLNLRSVVAVCHAVLPGMQQRGRGSIVNVSSLAGILGSAGGAVYAAAKAGVIGLTKSLASESGRYGVRVNAVAPGPIDTPLFASLVNGSALERRSSEVMVAATALRRVGDPAEVAAAIAFLASDDASYVTGETLTVSGGYR